MKWDRKRDLHLEPSPPPPLYPYGRSRISATSDELRIRDRLRGGGPPVHPPIMVRQDKLEEVESALKALQVAFNQLKNIAGQ